MAIKFGIIAEGITDIWTIENIIEGIFNDNNDEDIAICTPLQPRNLQDPGSYTLVFRFLQSEKIQQFLEDPNSYAIIHIDSDTIGHWSEYPFTPEILQMLKNISHIDGKSHDKIEAALENIRNFLLSILGNTKNTIYSRIIFAIAINDIECWILALHSNKRTENDKIVNCLNALINKGFTIDPNNKALENGRYFKPFIKGFMKNSVIHKTATKNKSLEHFVNQLNEIKRSII